MITKIKIKCAACGKQVEKLASEIKRQKKRGKKFFYCDLKCAGKLNCGHLKEHMQKHIVQSTERIKKYSKNQDEYSSFRYHINNAKRRATKYNREFDLDLYYLSDIWEKQSVS